MLPLYFSDKAKIQLVAAQEENAILSYSGWIQINDIGARGLYTCDSDLR